MDELTFVREKLRRGLQECLNELDKASIGNDLLNEVRVGMRLILLESDVTEYLHAVKAAANSMMEDTDAS